ncbi:MAG: 30S ribosome-binding factor RbfA [Coriobacteriia bacterium]|nr:30S ribosome-binding factor RbfA [Coriobacteriia bacterium]
MKSTPRTRRLGESVREALAEVLRDDVSDPRVDFATIISVEVSSDLNLANVYVTTHGGEAEYESLLEGLRSADKRIRAGLARRVQMRVVPELHYHLDTTLDQSMRITEALKDIPPTLLQDEDDV